MTQFMSLRVVWEDRGQHKCVFGDADLARIIHDHEDTKGLFCYKHVAET